MAKKQQRMIVVNGVPVPANKLPKSLVKEIDKAIKTREGERAKRRQAAEDAAKPVPFSIPELAKARPELAKFGAQLEKVLTEVGDVGMKFTEMQRDGQQMLGEMGKYKIAATLEYTEELFPKPTLVFKARNLAEGDCVIEHAWSAFINKDKHTVFENQLLDYVLKQRPDGQPVEEEDDV